MTDCYLIVGLGNPGRDYDNTRHNIGFRAADALAAAYGFTFAKKQAKGILADGLIAERKVILVKPQTYMNLSGETVRPLIDFYQIPLANLLVISDDLDIPLGTIRIREKGGSGGQKGIKSIIDHVGTQEFPRLRIGIGRPPGRMDPAAYVLQPFAANQQLEVSLTLDRVVKAVDTWLRFGLALMMTRHNGTTDEAARNAEAQPPAPPKVAEKPPESVG
ncbi:MAG TPA: aminoacyl-tRNA hydrolase [Aggregatilineales bacterium]|nr:aminoacyl-tRNA hydrolase [Aggregatilineales bacterium]